MTEKPEHKDWESWIDEQIRRAQDQGQFDDLPGRGKPLDLSSNPYAGDREMAFKILSDAGYAPEWIELDKGIRLRLGGARSALVRAWARYKDSIHELDHPPGRPPSRYSAARHSPATRERCLAAWQAAVAAFRQEVVAINSQIADLNLKVPSPRFQRLKVDVEQELRSLEEEAI